jgi:hypothetical protein
MIRPLDMDDDSQVGTLGSRSLLATKRVCKRRLAGREIRYVGSGSTRYSYIMLRSSGGLLGVSGGG